jgi:hypothetical protein
MYENNIQFPSDVPLNFNYIYICAFTIEKQFLNLAEL